LNSPELQPYYPVVVVGAGPVGLTTANLLGIEGVNTLLIEQHETTVQQPRAVSIDDEALRTMQAIDLSDEVLADVMPGYGSHYFTAGGSCFAKVEPSTLEYGYPRRSAFRQPLLEATLRNGLHRFCNVDVRFLHTLVSFDQDTNGVRLSIETPEGAAREIRCGYLVGCDGGQSRVRQHLGIELGGSTYRQRWLIIDIEGSSDRFRHTRVFCDPGRPGISLPGPGETRRFEFMLQDGESDTVAEDPGFVNNLLDRYATDKNPRIVRRQVYTFHARTAARWCDGRVFLAGDAAHLTPPFAGQGMNSGIRDAHNLAWKLSAVVSGRLPETVLDSYETERKPHARALIELAVNMGRIMMPASPLAAWLIQTGLRALRIYPPAQRYVTQMKFKPRPYFSVGLICSPRIAADKRLLGHLFPQPRLEQPNGDIVLFDHLAGRRFSLLIYAGEIEPFEPALEQWRDASIPLQVLWITPAHMMPAPNAPVECARDIDNALAALLSRFQDRALLLRPDHYVAAVIPRRELVCSGTPERFFAELQTGVNIGV